MESTRGNHMLGCRERTLNMLYLLFHFWNINMAT
jgi:hypothetical protein